MSANMMKKKTNEDSESVRLWKIERKSAQGELDPFDEMGISDYIQKNYGYSLEKTAESIKYLARNKKIFAEFLKYVKTGRFIPEVYAYRKNGYTAQMLYEQTDLPILNSFLEMIYLKDFPERATREIERFIACKRRKG